MADIASGQAARFLDLIRRSRRGKFKLYIGMIAGVGKTYRMLGEAREMLACGTDVQIGWVETHGRVETEAQLAGIPLIPRKKVFYKGKEIEEMDIDAILGLHPEVVVVDELAHTNIEGSRHAKRWHDVAELLDAGIHVLSAVNIQHIESLADEVERIVGFEVRERVPDSVLLKADEVVNIDLTADELIQRLKAGKIYSADKIQRALNNFFTQPHILQLRELALREVAYRVGRQVEDEVIPQQGKGQGNSRLLVCVSSNAATQQRIIRKAARMAARHRAELIALYVQTPGETPDNIPLVSQRHLMAHLELVVQLGGSVRRVESAYVDRAILEVCRTEHITHLCMGHPAWTFGALFLKWRRYRYFLRQLNQMNVDLAIFAS